MTDDNDTLGSSDDTASRIRLTGLRDAFEQAWHRGPKWEARYEFAGEQIHVRAAGTALARCVDAPLAHLRLPQASSGPELTIDLWDAHETGIAGPRPARERASGQSWTLDDGMLAVSQDGAMVSHATRDSILWLDRRERRIVGWVTDAHELPLYERARPLQILLALSASDRGVHAVHGAFVARDDRGVLLAGDSGTGKSTAALCCLEAGWTYLGDDWVGIGRAADGSISGHSLYGSVALEPAQVAHFPRLQRHAVPPRNGTDLKSLILLSDIFPEQLGRTAEVAALALPRVVDAVDTRIRPATRRDALLTMARSAICTMRPRGGRAAMETLTQLAKERPAFWLEVGRDLRQIPQRIDELLQATAS